MIHEHSHIYKVYFCDKFEDRKFLDPYFASGGNELNQVAYMLQQSQNLVRKYKQDISQITIFDLL